jgi:hypothetical protein
MPFQFSESHIEEYNTQGYTIFYDVLPTALIDDLRRVCERGRDLARQRHGPQSQRFQPVSAYEIDQKPFEDYRDLPVLRDAIARVLSPQHEHGDLSMLGVLLEPAEQPWCTHWHRDWRDNMRGLDLRRWEAVYQNTDLFNQVNCALYEDSCTWVIPGSHLRRDTPAEIARFPQRPLSHPQLEGLSAAARERATLEYCRSMPGAKRLFLDAGDFCLYRNTLWHLGNYIPYRRRATLHENIWTPAFRAWQKASLAECKARTAAGVEWENPNAVPIGSML